ncbi:MAG: aminotransferase class III-fold pyridoxal phosphate-dependent enzyme, partial [Clostridia bacterium]|nr:aminotransferase class III-fold pyridoxal phosphate-dependent enzyme [Clostridia bacterium]
MSITQLDKEYVAGTYARFPLELKNGKGAVVYDTDGKEYIDLGTGIAVNTFGYADDEWIAAVTKQMNALQHTSNLFYTEPCAKLTELLCEKTGMKKVFFSNSGAEANECAIKTARRYSFLKYGEGRSTIVTLKNSFHGRTVTTLAATGQDTFHTEFGPFTEGFVYAEANNTAEVIALVKEHNCCAVMMEPVQGEGGVMKLDDTFVKEVYDFCSKNDVLLICDEVQTGNGRTGSLYAYQQFGISPDIVSTAKGLGGGLPIGATMLGEKVKDTLTPGSHGSTFGGNPIACAGAFSIISRIDEELLASVRSKSEYIFNELGNAEGIKSVSGMGLMIGLETEKDAKEVVAACREKG